MRKLRQARPATLTSALAMSRVLTSLTGRAVGSYDQSPQSPPGIGHNRPPAELETDDILWEGPAIHAFLTGLLRREQSLSATYYWIKKGWIPTTKVAGHLVASKRAIAQRLAAGTGLVG